ncbi:MAG: TolC family protein [Treponemataceae bacterium]
MRTSLFGIGRARFFARVPLFICLSVALVAPAGLFAQTAPATASPGASSPPTASPAAPEPIKLNADGAVALALERNLGLSSTRIDVGAKKRKVDTSWNVFIPTVDVGGTLGRWNVEKTGMGAVKVGATYAVYTYTLPEWLASGSLKAQLVLNAALFEGMKNLKLDYEAGVLTYDQAKIKLERDVRKSYFSILLLKENIGLMQSNIAAAERRVKQAQENYGAGLAPELTVLQARVAAENLKPALEEMRNGLDASLAAFAMNLGLPRGSRLELENVASPDFVVLNADALISAAATDRPDVRNLLQSIKLLDSAKKLSLYRYYTPNLILGWSFDPTFTGDPWKDDLFGENAWKQSSGMFTATISYNLDGLLPFSRNAQSLKDLDENKEKLNIALALTVRGMETEVDSLVQKLEKSRKSVNTLALNVDLAERAYKLSEEAYKAGAKDLLDVQNSELELRKAQLEVLKEKFNYVTGLLDLEYAIGVPFGTLTRKAK